MGSKGRFPPPHLRHPLPGPGMVHPDLYGPGIRPPAGPFPPFDMLPPPEVMEQKLAAQYVDMQRLATENQRLAATHRTLREDLAAAQHELQMLHAHIGAMKSEREQQMRGHVEKIAKLEDELKGAEPVRSELQQARADVEKLVAARQQLMSKVNQLTQDLHMAHADAQQIPALMSELENLRQEYQRCRISYEHEKKLFNDHLQSLQVMEKNYVTMAREVEKLRAQLTSTTNVNIRTGGPYGGTTGNKENGASGHPLGQKIYEHGYGVPLPQGQGHAPLPANSGAGASVNATGGTTSPNGGVQAGPTPSKPGYDALQGRGYEAPKGHGYDASRGPAYDVQRGHGYDTQRIHGYDIERGPNYDGQRGPSYDARRLPGYDIQRVSSYDAQRGPGYDVPRGLNYDASRGASYEAASRGAVGPRAQMGTSNNLPYGSATPPPRAGSGYDAPGRSGNPVRK